MGLCGLLGSLPSATIFTAELIARRRVAVGIKSLVNARSLQLHCASVLHESLLLPLLTYGSERMIWREKERFRIRGIQMDNLKRSPGYEENG